MSTTIDERVVEMRFDNSNFEKNVSTSMSTLEKLKKALKFDGASKGLEDIQTSAKKINLTPMAEAADNVTQRFSYMQMTIQHQLNNIVDSAVNAGKRIVSALTIDPIKTGFQEYETQINAVQTILANTSSKGTTLDDVNTALDELNKYADQTIYNFTEMTRNIGTFTAAGVDLDSSVAAIKGIANLAAVSGSTSQQASTAMYQLSQALAAGKVSLMDWNSVVNAGMGGEVFQNALRRTSEVMGTGAEAAIKKYGSFRESLTQGEWLTTDVLTETLNQFTMAAEEGTEQWEKYKESLKEKGYTDEQATEILKMANTATSAATEVKTFSQLWDTLKETVQSGWTQTWELLIGDFESAKKTLSALSNFLGGIVDKFSTRRNTILEKALKGSPFTSLIEKINKITGPINKVTDATKKVTDATKKYEEVVNRVIGGEFGNGQERFDKLAKAGYNWAKVQNMVNEKLGNSYRHNEELGKSQEKLNETQKKANETQKITIDDLVKMSDAQLKNIGFTKDEVAALRELEEQSKKTGIPLKEIIESNGEQLTGHNLLINSFKNLGNALVNTFKAIGSAWRQIFWGDKSNDDILTEKANSIYNLIAAFHKFTTYLEVNDEVANKLKRTFQGLFSIVHIVTTVIGGGLRLGLTLVSKILGAFDLDILSVTATIGDIITAIHNWIFAGNPLVKLLDKLISKLPSLVDKFKEWASAFKETPAVQKFIGVIAKIQKAFETLATMNFDTDSISHWIRNLADSFLELLKTVPGVMKQLGKAIVSGLDGLTGGLITKVKKFFSMFADTPELEAFANAMGRLAQGLSKLISTIRGIASDLWNKATSMGKNIIEGLQNGLGEGTGNIIGKIIEIATNLINAFCDIMGIHSPSTVAFEWGKNIIDGLVNGIKAAIGKIAEIGTELGGTVKEFAGPLFESTKETISNFIDKVKEFSSKIDWTKVFLGGITIGSFATIYKICDTIQALTKPFESISSVVESFADTIADVGKAQAKNLNREALMKTAIAIGVLVAAIALLVHVAGDNYGQIWNAVGVIVVIAAVLAGLSVAMDKLGAAAVSIDKNGIKLDGLKKSLASIGVAIVLMAVAVKLISGLDPKAAKQGFIGLAEIMASILVFMGACSVIANKDKDITSFGKMMKQMAVAMLLMLAVIKISAMMDPADILTGLIVIEMFTLITIQMAFANKIAGKEASKFGKNMKQIATAMILMLAVVKLSSMMDPGDIIIGIAVIEAFVLISMEMALANKIAGGEATKFGGTMIKMAIALGLMVGVVKLISLLDAKTILKGVIGIQAFTLIIAEMLLIAKLGENSKNIAATVIAMSAAIGILAGICILLGMVDIASLAKGIVAVGMLSLIMSNMMLCAQNLEKSKGSLIALTVAIGIMALAVVGLSFIKPEKLIPAVTALTILMGMFGLMAKLASGATASIGALVSITVVTALLTGLIFAINSLDLQGSMEKVSSIGTLLLLMTASLKILSGVKNVPVSGLITMTAVIALLTGLLWAINALNIQGSIETVTSIGILLLAMSASLKMISGVQHVSASALGSMVILGLIIAELALVLKMINVLDIQASLPTVLSLSILLIALSGATLILSMVGAGCTSAMMGAVGLAGVVLILGGLMVAIGSLVSGIPKVEEFLNRGISVLKDIGIGLGEFIGGFVGGIGVGFCEQLPAMSDAITKFVNNFTEIDSSSLDGVNALVDVIKAIAGASIIDTLATLFNFGGKSPIEKFKENAGQLVDAVVYISDKLNGVTINEAQIESVAKAGQLFSTLANSIPSTDGWLQKLTGIKDLSGFGESISSYCKELIKINDAVNVEGFVFNSTAIEAFATAGTAYASLVNSIPATDGWIQKITGVKDLGNFGSSIATYIGELKIINDKIGDSYEFNSKVIKSFATVGSAFSDLVNSIPVTDGWLQKITGIKDLGNFGTSIATYVGELKKVNISLGSDFVFNVEAFKSLKKVGSMMSELQSSLDGVGSVIEWFTGRSDLGTFGTNIGLYAEGITKLKTGMGEDGISEAVITSVTNAGKALLALNDSLPEEGFFDSKITMTEFSTYISNFSDAISNFSTKASTINSEAINVAISAANRIRTLISTIADLDTSGIATFTGVGTGGFGADGAAYKIAQAMAAFSEKVAGIDTAAVSTSVSSALQIRTLIAGLVGLDYSGIESFKPQSIGSAMKSYSDKVAGIEPSIVSKSISAANRLRIFISSLSGLDTSGIGNFRISSIGSSLKAYAGSVSGMDASTVSASISAANRLKNFISSLAGIDTSGVDKFKSAVSSLGKVNIGDAASSLRQSASKLSSVGTDMVSSLAKGMTSSSSKVTSSTTKIVSDMLKTITNKASSFQQAGVTTMTKFINGISSKKMSLSTAVMSSVSTAASRIKGQFSTFYSSGKYLGEGLVLGINAKQSAAWTAGYNLGKAAADGEKAGQKSNSPSKLTIQAGKWLGEGLVIGIGKMTSSVYKAGYNLGDSAVGTISSSIAKISEYVSNGIDAEPTIRPIMDLSDIESVVGALDGMLGQDLTFGASARVSSISSTMNGRNQNGVNSDVVSAINKLSKQLSGIGNTTYNVNGITYDDGSNISDAVKSIVRAARIERRV